MVHPSVERLQALAGNDRKKHDEELVKLLSSILDRLDALEEDTAELAQ